MVVKLRIKAATDVFVASLYATQLYQIPLGSLLALFQTPLAIGRFPLPVASGFQHSKKALNPFSAKSSAHFCSYCCVHSSFYVVPALMLCNGRGR